MRSSSPPWAPKRSRSMTPPSLRMQARRATRPRIVISQPSCQGWTARTLDPQKRRSPVLQVRLLHATARSWPVLLRCLSAITAAALALTLGAPIAAHADDSVALVTAWQALNEDCRGGSGDDPQTMNACERRTVVGNTLRAHGCRFQANSWTCRRH